MGLRLHLIFQITNLQITNETLARPNFGIQIETHNFQSSIFEFGSHWDNFLLPHPPSHNNCTSINGQELQCEGPDSNESNLDQKLGRNGLNIGPPLTMGTNFDANLALEPLVEAWV